MEEKVPEYVFMRGQRGIFAEVYFPKRVTYQSAIFVALQEGLIDDVNLFIFGYLVRRFWEEALLCGTKEEELWVTSFFTLNLNIVKQQQEE